MLPRRPQSRRASSPSPIAAAGCVILGTPPRRRYVTPPARVATTRTLAASGPSARQRLRAQRPLPAAAEEHSSTPARRCTPRRASGRAIARASHALYSARAVQRCRDRPAGSLPIDGQRARRVTGPVQPRGPRRAHASRISAAGVTCLGACAPRASRPCVGARATCVRAFSLPPAQANRGVVGCASHWPAGTLTPDRSTTYEGAPLHRRRRWRHRRHGAQACLSAASRPRRVWAQADRCIVSGVECGSARLRPHR